MSEPTTLYASGEDVISRIIETNQENAPQFDSDADFEAYYDIQRTISEIVQHDFKRIALQFPDDLLHDSVPIYRSLKSGVGPNRALYVLADTSYGSCCVDEVAAQHVDADAVVHYGYACLSQTSRLPVIYVFGKRVIEVNDCVKAITDLIRSNASQCSNMLLKADVVYAHKLSDIRIKLQEAMPDCLMFSSTIPLFTEPKSTSNLPASDDASTDALDIESIVYIGGESLALTNLLLTNSSCQVFSYDPRTAQARLESGRSNKLLMKRYVAVQKARDADVFGILVGTLGVASYLPLITKLRSLLQRARKKSYTISVGKLNPAKLANFLEIECFVLVACPENSVIEAKEFLRPIITPYELEVALQPEPSWPGHYELDFGKLVQQSDDGTIDTSVEQTDDPDQPQFSLVTGRYRQAKHYDGREEAATDEPGSTALIRQQTDVATVLAGSAAAQFLKARTYRGLETRLGEDLPSVLEQGLSGIARGYQVDHRPRE